MSKEQTDLLPCAHCEGEGKTCQNGGVVYVVCLDCHAQGAPIATSHSDPVGEAIAAWNRRAVPLEAQAVAWLLTHPLHGETLSQHPITDGDRSLGWTDTPLYAASPSPAGGVQGVRIAELEAALRPLVYIAEWHEGTLAHDSDTIIEFKNADGSSYSLTVGHARDARTALTSALSSQAQTTGGVE